MLLSSPGLDAAARPFKRAVSGEGEWARPLAGLPPGFAARAGEDFNRRPLLNAFSSQSQLFRSAF